VRGKVSSTMASHKEVPDQASKEGAAPAAVPKEEEVLDDARLGKVAEEKGCPSEVRESKRHCPTPARARAQAKSPAPKAAEKVRLPRRTSPPALGGSASIQAPAARSQVSRNGAAIAASGAQPPHCQDEKRAPQRLAKPASGVRPGVRPGNGRLVGTPAEDGEAAPAESTSSSSKAKNPLQGTRRAEVKPAAKAAQAARERKASQPRAGEASQLRASEEPPKRELARPEVEPREEPAEEAAKEPQKAAEEGIAVSAPTEAAAVVEAVPAEPAVAEVSEPAPAVAEPIAAPVTAKPVSAMPVTPKKAAGPSVALPKSALTRRPSATARTVASKTTPRGAGVAKTSSPAATGSSATASTSPPGPSTAVNHTSPRSARRPSGSVAVAAIAPAAKRGTPKPESPRRGRATAAGDAEVAAARQPPCRQFTPPKRAQAAPARQVSGPSGKAAHMGPVQRQMSPKGGSPTQRKAAPAVPAKAPVPSQVAPRSPPRSPPQSPAAARPRSAPQSPTTRSSPPQSPLQQGHRLSGYAHEKGLRNAVGSLVMRIEKRVLQDRPEQSGTAPASASL